MAVNRIPPTCLYCGKPYKAIYNERLMKDDLFFGDAFERWDFGNHKCKKKK